MERENRAPALLAALALHIVVLGAGLITLPLWSKPVELVNSTPVTIVSHAPPEAPSATVQAPEPTPAAAPEPAPTPQPAPPRPAPPQPVPPPALAPTPKPAPPLPSPPKAQSDILSHLIGTLPAAKPQPKNSKPSPPQSDPLKRILQETPGHRGPPSPQAGPERRPGPPAPLTGDEMGAVTAKLMRLWHPNCGAEGVGKVVVRVEMHLTPDGRLTGPPALLDRPVVDAAGPVAQASAQRALSAVRQGEPYTELPRDRYAAWQDITVRFDAKEACSGQ